MRKLFMLICVFLFVAVAIAQDTGTKHAAQAAAQQPPSVKQLPEMKKMVDSFAGVWKTTTTVEKNEWFPAAGTATGKATIQAGPAGNSITERHRSNGVIGNFSGFGLYWWDAPSSAYKGVWCDTMDPRGCGDVGTGKWEGANLVFNNDMDTPQGKMHMRETFSNITKDSYDFMIESVMGSAPPKKMMSIKYTRSSASSGMPSPTNLKVETK